jgi:hypothetical protein
MSSCNKRVYMQRSDTEGWRGLFSRPLEPMLTFKLLKRNILPFITDFINTLITLWRIPYNGGNVPTSNPRRPFFHDHFGIPL